MVITIAVLVVLSAPAQSPPREPSSAWYRRHLPVTIEVLQDVEVNRRDVEPDAHLRGTLIGNPGANVRIKKGQTFQMIKLYGEGECRIRFEKREWDLGSCPWLEGFRDRETDFYRPVTNKRRAR
jgi:hypothetical protein